MMRFNGYKLRRAAVVVWLCAAGELFAVWPYDTPPTLSTEDLLGRVRDRYAELSDFQARIAVVTTSAGMGDSFQQKGNIFARQPNLFRIEFEQPSPQTIIFDGEYMYVYVPGETRVMRYEGSNLAGIVNLPQTLEALDEDYDVKLAAETPGHYELSLTAKGAHTYYPRLTLWVGKQQLVIVRADLFDSLNNCTSYRFSSYSFNVGVRRDRFRLDVPSAEILDMGAAF